MLGRNHQLITYRENISLVSQTHEIMYTAVIKSISVSQRVNLHFFKCGDK